MFKRSTIQLLRFPFSYFLMPVFWFALSFVPHIHWDKAILIFCILHLLVYPSSNGYNSYMDRDTDSIGGIRNPLMPEKELFYVTLVMDILAVGLALLVSALFTALSVCYIVFSRLYSYRGIRLKRFPVLGYLTVIINQGGVVFFMVYYGVSGIEVLPWYGIAAACFLIGGFYPITQIYQHDSDQRDHVSTISLLLGKKGTFVFCAFMYLMAFGILYLYYWQQVRLLQFVILQCFFLPVAVYFIRWAIKVWKNESLADFEHTMRMNWIASTLTTLAFITLILLPYIG